MALFLMNAVAGRVWCGYLCPQTVWTDLFQTIERWVEGDRREHLRRDQQPWTVERLGRTGLKHFLWLMVAWWTGGAWVLYFADAPTLVKELATLRGAARRLCLDRHPHRSRPMRSPATCASRCASTCVRGRASRPRSPTSTRSTSPIATTAASRAARSRRTPRLREQGLPAGDCIDCLQCVYVCPTGVDIRNGPNLGCIQCGLCIDACDAVMAKIGRPTRLIAYDTDLNIKRRQDGKPPDLQDRAHAHGALRRDHRRSSARIMLYTLGDPAERRRSASSMTATRCSCGSPTARSAMPTRVRILNKTLETRSFALTVDGLPDIDLKVVGDTVATGRTVGGRGRPRPDPRAARAGRAPIRRCRRRPRFR